MEKSCSVNFQKESLEYLRKVFQDISYYSIYFYFFVNLSWLSVSLLPTKKMIWSYKIEVINIYINLSCSSISGKKRYTRLFVISDKVTCFPGRTLQKFLSVLHYINHKFPTRKRNHKITKISWASIIAKMKISHRCYEKTVRKNFEKFLGKNHEGKLRSEHLLKREPSHGHFLENSEKFFGTSDIQNINNHSWFSHISEPQETTQQTLTCSKSTIRILETGVNFKHI